MTTNTREPNWVPGRRALKASQLAESLRANGTSATDAARFNAQERRAAEATAKLHRKASDETWRVTLDMLAGSTQQHALCPFCWHGDPEGSPGPRKPYGHPPPCAT